MGSCMQSSVPALPQLGARRRRRAAPRRTMSKCHILIVLECEVGGDILNEEPPLCPCNSLKWCVKTSRCVERRRSCVLQRRHCARLKRGRRQACSTFTFTPQHSDVRFVSHNSSHLSHAPRVPPASIWATLNPPTQPLFRFSAPG
eukprot:3157126-Amphidinium_carterae.1